MQIINSGEVTASLIAVPFTSVDATNLQTRLTGNLSLSARVIKADQTSVAGAGNFDEPDSINAPGCRRYTPAATDTSVFGPMIIRISGTGMEPREIATLILPYAPHDAPGARTPGWLPIQSGETVAARRSVPFTAVSSSNLQTRLDASLLVFTVRIIKADGTSAAGAGSVVQPDGTNAQGCCFYICGSGDVDTAGETIIRISATGMEPREMSVTVVNFDPYAVNTAAVITNAATQESIRDRIYTLIEALAPTSLTKDKFRRYRNEGGADFEGFAEKDPAAAFRRVQVREVGDDEPPLVSNTTVERVRVRYHVVIAYPQTHRYGPNNAMDRDDVMNQDWKSINYAIGIYGRGNFSGANDCTPLGAVKSREQSGAVDYLVIAAEYEYQRATA